MEWFVVKIVDCPSGRTVVSGCEFKDLYSFQKKKKKGLMQIDKQIEQQKSDLQFRRSRHKL